MLNFITELYSKLPEGAKQIPAAGLLIIAISTYVGGRWMSTSACTDLRGADQKVTDELRKERDEYKAIAFESVRFLNERAKQSVKINEEATETPEHKPESVVATVKVPVIPVTKNEKQELEKQATDAQPQTLERSLNVSKQVLSKNDINNAKVQSAEKPE